MIDWWTLFTSEFFPVSSVSLKSDLLWRRPKRTSPWLSRAAEIRSVDNLDNLISFAFFLLLLMTWKILLYSKCLTWIHEKNWQYYSNIKIWVICLYYSYNKFRLKHFDLRDFPKCRKTSKNHIHFSWVFFLAFFEIVSHRIFLRVRPTRPFSSCT